MLAERGPLLRYGAGVALAALSLLLLHLLRDRDPGDYSSLALASVVLSAIYGGRGPALLATAITAIGLDYLLYEPHHLFKSWAGVVHVVVHGLVGLLIAEITARLREAYRELRAEHAETVLATRARENVLAIVSHDLRSPLSAILAGAEYLERLAQGEIREVALGVERCGRQMSRLIEDLLDAVKIEKGQFRIDPGSHDLVSIVGDALQGSAAAAQAKGVRLVPRFARDTLHVRCDRGRIAQVLSNLLANAVKFSPQGAAVEIELEAQAQLVRIAVRDYGPGIPEEALPHIFERYWQARGTAHHGTGLGLFISKSIVEAHGGRIEVATGPGAGSVFSVFLPRP